MMGHKEKLANGDEVDALTRAKRFYVWRSDVRKAIKKQFSKRVRKDAKVIDMGDTE